MDRDVHQCAMPCCINLKGSSFEVICVLSGVCEAAARSFDGFVCPFLLVLQM